MFASDLHLIAHCELSGLLSDARQPFVPYLKPDGVVWPASLCAPGVPLAATRRVGGVPAQERLRGGDEVVRMPRVRWFLRRGGRVDGAGFPSASERAFARLMVDEARARRPKADPRDAFRALLDDLCEET